MQVRHDVILFDLDGTISDPLAGIGGSINYALSHFGYPEILLPELARYVGPPLDQTFSAITGLRSTSAVESFVAKYRERYGAVGYSENILYPGIPQVLPSLAATGVTLGLCTSKRVDMAEKVLELFGLAPYFKFVSGGEIGIEKWQQIEDLLKKELVNESTVMVGDRAVDLIAAHRNGLPAAGVLWGYGSRQELEAEQPRYLFNTPEELLSLTRATDKESKATVA
jgi:phosphoglycolate phosphatase